LSPSYDKPLREHPYLGQAATRATNLILGF
jgi:hypothetical protein